MTSSSQGNHTADQGQGQDGAVVPPLMLTDKPVWPDSVARMTAEVSFISMGMIS
jgi:hypothetical protein